MLAYIEMALEPEIQRIMFRDGPAVLGDLSHWPSTQGCIPASPKPDALKADGFLIDIDPEGAARLINGAAATRPRGSPMPTIRRPRRSVR